MYTVLVTWNVTTHYATYLKDVGGSPVGTFDPRVYGWTITPVSPPTLRPHFLLPSRKPNERTKSHSSPPELWVGNLRRVSPPGRGRTSSSVPYHPVQVYSRVPRDVNPTSSPICHRVPESLGLGGSRCDV